MPAKNDVKGKGRIRGGAEDKSLYSLYRWIEPGKDEEKSLLETGYMIQTSGISTRPLWAFDIDGEYKYSNAKGKILVKFQYKPEVIALLGDPRHQMDSEGADFAEAAFPDKVIMKNNEIGAYGIGTQLLLQMNAHLVSITLASSQEVAKALGIKEMELGKNYKQDHVAAQKRFRTAAANKLGYIR